MIAMATLIIIGLTGQSVLADDQRKSPFVGLWEGIDPDDGATQLRSITRNEDGTFSLVGRASYLNLCGGTDRGVIIGTGAIEEGVFNVKTAVTCFDGRPPVMVEADYTPDRENGTLVEVRSIEAKPQIIFHLTSPEPKYQMGK